MLDKKASRILFGDIVKLLESQLFIKTKFQYLLLIILFTIYYLQRTFPQLKELA